METGTLDQLLLKGPGTNTTNSDLSLIQRKLKGIFLLACHATGLSTTLNPIEGECGRVVYCCFVNL